MCYFKILSLLFISRFLPVNLIKLSLVIALRGWDWLRRNTGALSPKLFIILGGHSYTLSFLN